MLKVKEMNSNFGNEMTDTDVTGKGSKWK